MLRFLVTFFPFRRNQNQFTAVLLVFDRKDIPRNILQSEEPIEVIFHKKNGFYFTRIIPIRNKISNHLDVLRRRLDLCYSIYENFIYFWRLKGGLSAQMT